MLSRFKRPKWMRKYHRWLGVLVAVPWIWLAVTGLLLRQDEALKLSQRKIYSGALLKHYGVYPQEEALSYLIAGTKAQYVTLWGGTLYKDGNPLGPAESLKGACAAGANLAVATEEELFLYDANLEFYDSLDELSLAVSHLDAIGSGTQEHPVIFKSGDDVFLLNKDFLTVSPLKDGLVPNAEYSKPGKISTATMETIKRFYAEDVGIPYSRLILDLHSGNFFGTAGKVIIDLSAFLSIILTVLGLLLVKKKWKS